MTDLLADHTDLFKLYSDDCYFRRWLSEKIFTLTYRRAA